MYILSWLTLYHWNKKRWYYLMETKYIVRWVRLITTIKKYTHNRVSCKLLKTYFLLFFLNSRNLILIGL